MLQRFEREGSLRSGALAAELWNGIARAAFYRELRIPRPPGI